MEFAPQATFGRIALALRLIALGFFDFFLTVAVCARAPVKGRERMHEFEQQYTDSESGYYFTCHADGAVRTFSCVFAVERVAGGGKVKSIVEM
jgi:hypothetical protein